MTLPGVLGLSVDQARARLEQSGVASVQVVMSGRRREGTPRVIRVTDTSDGVLLVATCIRVLEQPGLESSPKQDA
jgi:hypothetical protein